VKHNKILVVDDDTAQCHFFKMVLDTYNYEVFVADNGVQALQILKENLDIRLVLTDLSMPEMDGFELIRQIRKKERRYTYILVVSSASERDSIIKALDLGANDYVNKPVVPRELQLRLNGASQLLRLESQDEFILSMAKMAEYRSKETGFHLDRVKIYTQLLANDLVEAIPELKISEHLAQEISQVSALHDIGKVAIPDKILHKRGALTSEEFEVMKSHTSLGGDLLKELYEKTGADYLKVAYDIAMHHHERWDGKGYPHGLKGTNIPIAARIMTLADTYDAMISKRCYKESFDHSLVKTTILEDKGTRFDPVVVESFLRQEDLWLTVMERYDDSSAMDN